MNEIENKIETGSDSLQNLVKPGLEKSSAFSWPKAFVIMTIVVVVGILVGMFMFFSNASKVLGEAVTSEAVKTRFESYVVGLQGRNHLQVAQLQTQEEFLLTSEKKLFKYFPGGTVEVAAKVPCEIVYNVSLKDSEWRFVVVDHGRRLQVIAPEIQFNKPAVDLAKYDIQVVKYSIIRNEEEAKLLLQGQIPDKLLEIAEKNIDSVRDTARLNIKEFIENWLLASFNGKREELPVVDRVYFSDEEDRFRNIILDDKIQMTGPK